jgi:hypothetical protein
MTPTEYFSRYHKEGYFILKNKVTQIERTTMLDLKSSLTFRPIFKELKNDEMDDYRLQAPIADKECVIHNKIQRIANTIEPRWIAHNWVMLHSKVGGVEQEVHRDYMNCDVSDAATEAKAYPGGLIVALMEGTKLKVFPNGFGVVKLHEEETVELEPGDILVFRGDLAHAGMAYDEDNYRLHCYLMLRNYDPIPNTTEAVVPYLYPCKHHCGRVFLHLFKYQGHVNHCKKNPNREEYLRKVAGRKSEKVPCEGCDKEYARSYLIQHRKKCNQGMAENFGKKKRKQKHA